MRFGLSSAIVLGVFQDGLALKCNTTSDGELGFVINSQQDFDLNLAGCTALTGPLWIGSKYQGALNMSSITSIGQLTSNANTTLLTDLYLEDLIFISSLMLSHTPALNRLRLPKLTTLRTAFITPDFPLEVDLPSLVTVEEYLRLEGPIASFMAPKLYNVTGMRINNEAPKSGPEIKFALDLPSLERANKLEIYGINTKSVSLPKLKMIGTSFLFNVTPALDLELPTLKITNTTTLITKSSLLLPSLERSSGLLSINLKKAAKITLPALYYAENINVSGRILDLFLPAIISMYSLVVSNDLPADRKDNGLLDCANINAAWQKAQERWEGGKYNPRCWGKSLCGVKLCSVNKPTGSRNRLIIGLSVALPILAVALVVFLLWRSKARKAGRTKMSRPESQITLHNQNSANTQENNSAEAERLTAAGRRYSEETLPPPYTEEEQLPAYTRTRPRTEL